METKRQSPKTKTNRKQPIAGSVEAKRIAAGILEVMSGERGPSQVSEVLGISSMRYYALEERAIQGMVAALEPRSKGRQATSPEDAMAKLIKERDRLKRDLDRSQALLRVVRKSMRLTELSKPAKGRRRQGTRPKKIIERLSKPETAPIPVTGSSPTSEEE